MGSIHPVKFKVDNMEEGRRYAALGELLQRLGSPLHTEEFHGCVTAIICRSGIPSLAQWQSLLGITIEPGNLLHSEAIPPLLLEMRTIDSDLADPLLVFTPLLPADDQPLWLRMQGLALWCQGFTLGLCGDAAFRLDSLTAASREMVNDLLDISRLEATTLTTDEDGDGERDEEDEQALQEIIEYVRIGVLSLRDDLLELDGQAAKALIMPTSPTLH
ncbi:MAG: UPF0149 family protein [Gammaproteobacteria bacterium]|nr:UPF0149 family protein [Gammaproteobacteria bacterium]